MFASPVTRKRKITTNRASYRIMGNFETDQMRKQKRRMSQQNTNTKSKRNRKFIHNEF